MNELTDIWLTIATDRLKRRANWNDSTTLDAKHVDSNNCARIDHSGDKLIMTLGDRQIAWPLLRHDSHNFDVVLDDGVYAFYHSATEFKSLGKKEEA